MDAIETAPEEGEANEGSMRAVGVRCDTTGNRSKRLKRVPRTIDRHDIHPHLKQNVLHRKVGGDAAHSYYCLDVILFSAQRFDDSLAVPWSDPATIIFRFFRIPITPP